MQDNQTFPPPPSDEDGASAGPTGRRRPAGIKGGAKGKAAPGAGRGRAAAGGRLKGLAAAKAPAAWGKPGGRKTHRAEEPDDDPERSARVAAIVDHLQSGAPVQKLAVPAPVGDSADGEDEGTEARAEPATGARPRERVVRILPQAGPARLKNRHRGLMMSFVLVVLLPLACVAAYLFFVAQDQYASTVGFTVRREEGATSSTELLGGLAQFAGSSGTSEADILYEFIQSQEIVALIDERIGLGDLYSVHWPGDPLMALWQNPTIEELHSYWKRMVRITYDQGTRLIELRVLAFDPTDAQRIAHEIVRASQSRINDLNTQARADVMRYANEDLEAALSRLKIAREALSRFRTRTQIVDPAADIQGRMGVLNNLQQQLAQALIENDIVLGTTQEGDPRRQQAARRIQVIRDRIADERKTFSSDAETNVVGENYPALIAEFESLTVDLQFAEETYRASLAAVDVARANASRQSLYLAPYITPTLPQTAEYPQRLLLSALAALFLTLLWSIGALIYYSVRDRS